jgi:predicted dehydrogenase
MKLMATEIRFGIIGLGLMGREFASAAARWMHLTNLDARPVIVAACDSNANAFDWFKRPREGKKIGEWRKRADQRRRIAWLKKLRARRGWC